MSALAAGPVPPTPATYTAGRAALEKFTLGVATSLPKEGCKPPWLLADELRVEGIGYPPRIKVMELGGSST
ncbi:hypothetical protein KKB55_15380 [Myxococcota bacterium]|nr:hypothetical protein [Myxococcota bacterium]MBU1899120.1 hypothetical protein [Myxococcota bacterium]